MLSRTRNSSKSSVFLCLVAFGASLHAQTNVLTQHNDVGRTGQNTTETILTPSNVNTTNFGKLLTLPVDGSVYAQPLYVSDVVIGGTAHHVVFIATEHDSVYAFDSTTGVQLWKASMLDSAHGAAPGATSVPLSDTNCNNIVPEYGITGTPVIDAVTGTLYAVSESLENNYAVQRLHALDITTGNEKLGAHVAIAGSTPGTGSGSSGGVMTFDPKWENQRAGLLEVNGNIYVAFGSHCDFAAWHGWIFGYNATTFAQTAVFLTTPRGSASGIWMGGAGLAADVQNGVTRIFPVTGNGSYDATTPYGTNTMDYGDDILRLTVSSSGGLTVADAFTPDNQLALENADADVGSGGSLLLPDQSGSNPHLLVQLGKSGALYVVNRDNMGGYSLLNNNIVQQVSIAGGLWGVPAYWNGNVYVWPRLGSLSRYSLTNGKLSSSPNETSSQIQLVGDGNTPSISASGTQNGVVWSVDPRQSPPVIYAHDASNVSQLLWSSTQNLTRDALGPSVPFIVPTIADGRVFVGGVNQVQVYGLLASVPPQPPDFALSASPTFVSIAQGTSSTSLIGVSSISGFSGPVTLTATGLPSGVTAAFSAAGSGTSLLALTAVSTAPLKSVTITITGKSGALSHAVPLTISVVNAAAVGASTSVNLSSFFNVYGIFNNGSTITNGGLDGASNVYSANLLGTSLTALGVPFTFGTPGSANAVTSRTVSLPAGNFTSLSFLGTAVNGNQANQQFVVTYIDGTTATFTQSISDWGTPQGYAGESKALSMAGRLNPSGSQSGMYAIYAYSFTLNSAKTVSSITLPANRNVTVFALALSSNPISVNMTSAFNVHGIFANGATVTNGGLDGNGNAYSSNLLGGSLTALGVPFTFGTPGASNAAANVTVPLPAGSFTTLSFLGTGVNGNQASQKFLVTYVDGTSFTFTQSLSNWLSPQQYTGETTVLTTSGRSIYAYAFALNSMKTVKSVTLPANRNVTVLAITLSSGMLNDTSAAIAYGSTWAYAANRNLGDFANDVHYTKTNGDVVSFTFTGTGIDVISPADPEYGTFTVTLDGVAKGTFTETYQGYLPQSIVYSVRNLTPGGHTIKLAKLSNTYFVIDGFKIVP